MGLIRNLYRAISGRMSLAEARKYNENLNNFRVETGYKGKITKASARENLDFNKKLQLAVYNAEKKKKVIEARKYKTSYLESAKQINDITPIRSINDRHFKQELALYVKSYYWDVAVEKQKQIYLNLFNLYKETYEDPVVGEIEKLEDSLSKLAKMGLERRRKETERRAVIKQRSLERLAA